MANVSHYASSIHQCHLSGYACWRRFLLSNPVLSMSEAKHVFRGHKPYTAVPKKISKNCPICAYYFFHSELYELPWIQTCPLHNIPLSTHCTHCNQPWPNKEALRTRNCRECGCRASYGDIAVRKLYEVPSNLSRLQAIKALVAIHDKTKGSILSINAPPWMSQSQNTVDLYNPLMPSLFSAYHRSLRSPLQLSGVKIEPAYIFNVIETEYIRLQDVTSVNNTDCKLEASLIADTRYKIFKFIEGTLKDESYSEEPFLFDMTRLFNGSNIYFLAYCIWQELMAKRKNGYRDWSELDFGYLYRDTLYKNIPLIPSIKPYANIEGIQTDAFGCIDTYHTILVPLPAVVVSVLYKIELWGLFFNILCFLDRLKIDLKDGQAPAESLFDYLSKHQALPEQSCMIDVAILRGHRNSVNIVIPQNQSYKYRPLADTGEHYGPYSLQQTKKAGHDEYFFGKYKFAR